MKNLFTIAIAALLSTSFSTFALEREGSVGVTTNYIDRGITLSDDDFAVQASYDLSWANGINAGVWGSTVAEGGEFAIYAGYTHNIVADVNVSAGAIQYIYTDDVNADYLEYNIAINSPVLTIDNIGLELDYSDDDAGKWTAVALTFSETIAWDLEVYGEIGATDYDGEDVIHGKVGVGAELMENLVLSVEYHDTDNDAYTADDQVLASIFYSF